MSIYHYQYTKRVPKGSKGVQKEAKLVEPRDPRILEEVGNAPIESKWRNWGPKIGVDTLPTPLKWGYIGYLGYSWYSPIHACSGWNSACGETQDSTFAHSTRIAEKRKRGKMTKKRQIGPNPGISRKGWNPGMSPKWHNLAKASTEPSSKQWYNTAA